MSNPEEESACQVCADFEPQAWRKSLCRNCFHYLEEHSETLLAAQAEVGAKEKATEEKNANKPVTCERETEKSKNFSSSNGKGKVTENGKGAQLSKDSSKQGKTNLSISKSASPSAFTASFQQSKTTTKHTVSMSSVKSSTTSNSTLTTTQSTKVTSTSLSTNESSSKSAQFSKAKSLTSKFENKASAGTSYNKKQDLTKPPLSTKLDSKGRLPDSASKQFTKTPNSEQSKTKDDEKKDTFKSATDTKDKKFLPASKLGDKNSKDFQTRSKPLGKDTLKSTKDSPKKDSKANESVSDKIKPKVIPKDSLKPISQKSVTQNEKDKTIKGPQTEEDKTKKIQNEKRDKILSSSNDNIISTTEQESGQRLEHSSSTGAQTLSSTGNKTVPGESNKKIEKDCTHSGKVDIVCESADISVRPITAKGKANDDTQKFQNDNGDIEKTNRLSCVSNKNTKTDEHSIFKDRGKGKVEETERGSVSGITTSNTSSTNVSCVKENDNISPDISSIPSSSSSVLEQTSSVSSSTSASSELSPPIVSNLTNSSIKDTSKSKALKGTGPETKDGSSTSEANAATCEKNGVASAAQSCIETETLTRSLDEKNEQLRALEQQVSKMESEMKELEKEKQQLLQDHSSARQTQKEDMEKLLQDLRSQLDTMGTQCDRLQSENQAMLNKLHEQENSIKRDQETRGKNLENIQLEEDLEIAEKELEEVKDENKELQSQVMEMKNEMDEMYDHFRENEHEEFRDLQKELDMTAKNCRILQFKLRKSERRNEQIEEDRLHYEEKLRSLESQFDSQDAKNHIRILEEELRVAKEVSVRLHDELDIVEDRRNKALEENRHLTELLEHTDKRQFRLEMEIDKLRDVVGDLKMQLREAKGGNNNKETSPDRKPPQLAAIGKQGSKDYDVSQLMKDLYDCMERENDLKDQLKFTEDESKMMRKKVSEMDEENENLRLQLLKMSEKASKHKKKEQDTMKELEEERRQTEAVKAALTTQLSNSSQPSPGSDPRNLQLSQELSSDVILIVDAEGSDYIECDETIPISQRKDSTDEDLMNVMQMRMQLEIMEQELMTSHKKLDDLDLENENLQAEVKFLQERLVETEKTRDFPETMTPNAFYEDKLKELNEEMDDLRWKLIEKDRELERLEAVQGQSRHSHPREQVHVKKTGQLKKSRSLEESDALTTDLKRQVDHSQMEVIQLRSRLEQSEAQNDLLSTENSELKKQRQSKNSLHPSEKDDELRMKLERLQGENEALAEKLKTLTDNVQHLTRATRNIATSPTVPGIRSLLDFKTEHTSGPGLPVHPPPQKGIIKTDEDSAHKSKGAQRNKEHSGKDKGVRFELLSPVEEKDESSFQVTEKPTPDTMAASDPSSLLEEYADGKSKVTITGDESRVELMEKVLDMDDEISSLLDELRKKDVEKKNLVRDMKDLKQQLEEAQDDGRRTEMDLLQELDMLHDKNSVMSNLLDIINERAEAAEEELEKRIQDEAGQSPTRSTSNVSEVSALSNTSVGSDEVFAGHGKDGVILRDWEAKLKVRIDSLERLLAEERQKVTTAEKKLLLAGNETLSPSVTDDVKLRMREKELLQEELLKSERHLHIATDQIQGLKERVTILEEEHERLRQDYAKLYDEIDRPKEDSNDVTPQVSDSDKTPEKVVNVEQSFISNKPSDQKHEELNETKNASDATVSLESELAQYKEKTRELEYKVEEINDIWRSKSATSDKERDDLEFQLKDKLQELNVLEATLSTLKQELITKNKIISDQELAIKENEDKISKMADKIPDKEEENIQREQSLVTQVSQRDEIIRELNETLRLRDERLKEKDEMLFKLNTSVERQKLIMNDLEKEKDNLNAMIVVLRGQNAITMHPTSANEEHLPCQTDAEKECFRLKEELDKLITSLEASTVEKRGIESSLERSRQALDEAMYNWDKERNTLQKDVNILEEKVRLYDAFNAMNSDDAIDSLKVEAQEYFREKESLACELSSLKMKSDAADKTHKEQIAHLQAELSDKLRLLKTEVDNNMTINTELERLRRQAEVSYRLQQEERILRAEHLSLKSRYESRIDKMNKENNKMLVTISKLQKECDLDREIIAKVEKNFTGLSEKYTEELLRSQEDKAALDRQMKEIDASRSLTDQLQKQMRELREQTLDQERLRAEMINKFATDRAAWEIVKGNLQSQINQLEEQVGNTSKHQERSKDIQANMGIAWDKERREQRRLLQEAHTLALDLQEQLKTREEAYAHERKELIRQMENDRVTWTRDKRENDRKINECESSQRKIVALQKQLKESRDTFEKEVETWRREKTESLRLLTEYRHVQLRDRQKVEDVLGGLKELTEYGTMLKSFEKVNTMEEKPPDRLNTSEQDLLKYVKESVCQISTAAEELSKYANTPQDGGASCLTKDEMFAQSETQSGSELYLTTDVSTRGATTTCRVEQQASMVSRQMTSEEARQFHSLREVHAFTASSMPVTEARQDLTSSQYVLQPSNNQSGPIGSMASGTLKGTFPAQSDAHNKYIVDQKLVPNLAIQSGKPQTQSHIKTDQDNESSFKDTRTMKKDCDNGTPLHHQTSKNQTSTLTAKPLPVILRSFDHHGSRTYNRPPSYSSGTRSAATSRATTPETPDMLLNTTLGHQNTQPSLPFPTTSCVIPHTYSQCQPKQQSSSLEQSVSKAKRPITFTKSLSVDNSLTSDYTSQYDRVRLPFGSSISANTTPTSPLSKAKAASLRESFSPRTARRKFFEEPHLFPPNTYPTGYKSLPHRRSESPSIHVRQSSLPDPSEVRREAEESYGDVSSKFDTLSSNLRLSSSFNEKIHQSANSQQYSESRHRRTESTESESSSCAPVTECTKPQTVKDKRSMFKKAISLDSHVDMTVAKAETSAVPPAASTGFSPSDLIATVKGKLKPIFKKKKSEGLVANPKAKRSQSPLFIQTEVPSNASHIVQQATSKQIEGPDVGKEQQEVPHDGEEQEVISELRSERSRDTTRRKEAGDKHGLDGNKWRSRSVDRPPQASPPQASPPDLWKFNETAV